MDSHEKKSPMDAYETSTILGSGTYGVVYKGRCKRTGRDVAIKKTKFSLQFVSKIKCLFLISSDQGIPSSSLREIAVLKKLTHENIVSLIDIVCAEKTLFLIFECLDMDLNKLLSSRKLSNEETKLCRAISFCHSHRILHRDIKPQNIFLRNDGTLKLGDFGLARSFNIPVKRYTQEVVTLWYRSPELLMDSYYYSTSVDTWSIGCIFSEMVNGSALFTGGSEIDQLFTIFKVLGTPNEEVWPGVSKYKYFQNIFPKWKKKNLQDMHPTLNSMGCNLLERFLIYDPSLRISAYSALQHMYFGVMR